ncbi:MAG: ADP-ribosylglycohydrolase family protein [Planctomycetaceae bacterium]
MSRAAIAGDIAGSRFERSLWEGRSVADARCVGYDVAVPRRDSSGEVAARFDLFHPDCHVTDDTILSVAVMDWLLHGGDPRVSLRAHFRRSSHPELFGRYFRAWATTDDEAPCGSVGNGAAMRAAPIGHVAGSEAEAVRLARLNAQATHTTDDAVAGAEAVALGVYLARTGVPRAEIGREIGHRFGYDLDKPLDAWRPGYRFTSACRETVPVAFRAFLEADGHEAAVRAAVSVGGDTDTVACMAGGLAGACWGIPMWVADRVADSLEAESLGVVTAFEKRYPSALRIAGESDAESDAAPD